MSNKTSNTPNTITQRKGETILKLLKHNTLGTIAELAKAASWQRHSVHGFMLSTLKKKQGLENKSSNEAIKDRRYLFGGTE